MSQRKSSSGKVGFFGFLTLIFITLKLTNCIDWSWWLVLAPVWGSFVLLILLLLALFTIRANTKGRNGR